MALPTQHIGINEINQHVVGNTGPLYNITDNADLGSSNVRNWGSLYALSGYNYGATGVLTGSTDEIAAGEFRGAYVPAPTTAFAGNMTHKYGATQSGPYSPTVYYDAANAGLTGNSATGFSNATYTGTLGGVSGTHTITALQNTGLSNVAGVITMSLQNSTAAYSNTGWTSITVGNVGTLQRSAASFSGSTVAYNGVFTASYTWGVASGPTYAGPYAYSTWFGGNGNISGGLYVTATKSFQMTF